MRVPLAVTVMCLLVSPAYAQLATPNETGLRYGHVHLNVSDIEAHKTLWVEHFGGVVVQKGALTAVRLPGMLVALTERKPTGGSQGTVMGPLRLQGPEPRNVPREMARCRSTGDL